MPPLLTSWKKRWEAVRPKWGLIGVGPPSEDTPAIYKELKKAKSSLLTQIRTRWIRLAAFLNKARVPNYPSLRCQCGHAEETASHIIAYCSRFTEQRQSLITGRPDIKTLISIVEGAKRLIRWFL